MKNKWKAFSMGIAVLLLAILLVRLGIALHNIDLAWNYVKVSNCDYVTVDECKSYTEIYIESFGSLDYIIIGIVAASVFLGAAIVIGE